MTVDNMTAENTFSQPQLTQPALNRREFLTYTWGAALALLAAEAGATSYFFLYPRFRSGEFGGQFSLGSVATLPPQDAAPQPNSTGKFWLVNTAEGPKAIYMVCTHLGCLYKWNNEENRFQCPCHGSQFTREGDYIQGPAPRSLDQFVIEVVQGEKTIATTTATEMGAQPPLVSAKGASLIVNTGKRINGPSKEHSPAIELGI